MLQQRVVSQKRLDLQYISHDMQNYCYYFHLWFTYFINYKQRCRWRLWYHVRAQNNVMSYGVRYIVDSYSVVRGHPFILIQTSLAHQWMLRKIIYWIGHVFFSTISSFTVTLLRIQFVSWNPAVGNKQRLRGSCCQINQSQHHTRMT